MSTQNNPPWAKGLCDRCGFVFFLDELHEEIYDERPNGLKVCEACLDEDHPQLQAGRIKADDTIALYDPRPDIDRRPSTTYFGWKPVGNPVTQTIRFELGRVIAS